MLKRKWIIFVVTILLGGIAIYAYREYNRKHVPMARLSADYTVDALHLISEFSEDYSAANNKYLGKVIVVDGLVKQVDVINGVMILGDSNSMHSVRCAMDSGSLVKLREVSRGLVVKIKGNCTGYNEDELLGSDVILNRAVIVHIF